MLPDRDIGCHDTGFTKTCFECVTQHRCQKWIQVTGTHPQTGESMNKWMCADAWMPILTIENSQQQRQTGAAVESFRNEMVKLNAPLLMPPEATRMIELN
jgi:hypothetical protein